MSSIISAGNLKGNGGGLPTPFVSKMTNASSFFTCHHPSPLLVWRDTGDVKWNVFYVCFYMEVLSLSLHKDLRPVDKY